MKKKKYEEKLKKEQENKEKQIKGKRKETLKGKIKKQKVLIDKFNNDLNAKEELIKKMKKKIKDSSARKY
jgi:hypothetical protein